MLKPIVLKNAYALIIFMVIAASVLAFLVWGAPLKEKYQTWEAVKFYERSAQEQPENAMPRLLLAQVYYKANRAQEAIEELETAEELALADTDDARKNESLAQAYAMMAEIYSGIEQDHKKAAQALQKLLAIEPGNGEARYQLGTAYAYMGYSQNAFREFSRVIAENPNSEIAQYAENAIQYVREKRSPNRSKYLAV